MHLSFLSCCISDPQLSSRASLRYPWLQMPRLPSPASCLPEWARLRQTAWPRNPSRTPALCRHKSRSARDTNLLFCISDINLNIWVLCFSTETKRYFIFLLRLVSRWWNRRSSTPRTERRTSRIRGFKGKSNAAASLYLILPRNCLLRNHFLYEKWNLDKTAGCLLYFNFWAFVFKGF